MPKALALRHTSYVDLDLVGHWLGERGFDVDTIEPANGDLRTATQEIAQVDLLIILGGNMGVYEHKAHPWILDEIALVKRRLAAGGPTLGLCFGSQIMAAALGAEVRKGPAGKEIGWRPLSLTEAGAASPLSALAGKRVMQWHGDTWSLPAGADLLASSETYSNQAFSAGPHALALQFHLEVSADGLEAWLNRPEDDPDLIEVNLSVSALRAQARDAFPDVRDAALLTLDRFAALNGLPIK